MKKLLVFLLALSGISFGQTNDDQLVVIPWHKVKKEAPLFFSADAKVTANVGLKSVVSTHQIAIKVHQGKAKVISLSLTGQGEVTEVDGARVKEWSVRTALDGNRFLDIHTDGQDDVTDPNPFTIPVQNPGFPSKLDLIVKTKSKVTKESLNLLLPGPAAATGFALQVSLKPDAASDVRVTQVSGLSEVEGSKNLKFIGSERAELVLKVLPSGAETDGLEMVYASLVGDVAGDQKSISFKLDSRVQTSRAGATFDLLAGGAALTSGTSGDGWHVVLKKKGKEWVYQLVADRAGTLAVKLEFSVEVSRQGDWKRMYFQLPAGVVVPVRMNGLEDEVTFDRSMAVVPKRSGDSFRGFLPVTGHSAMAWKAKDKVEDGSLFFSSTETADVRVGSGLLRQRTLIDLNVLQGKLSDLDFRLQGPGEVLSVTGGAVLGWRVVGEGDERKLDVTLSRPIEGKGSLIIESQAALGGFPVSTEALRIMPMGALRHSGWLRVANQGSVRIEVADAKGLIQLAPHQFPGGVNKNLRQVFVYRFPSADYNYVVKATQVLPEVGLSEVTVYELGETDLRIEADLELDIREAPLREWEMRIPEDYAVVSVVGPQVADYAIGSDVENGLRVLKVVFKQAVINRQLIAVSLEKNQAAKEGSWELKPLVFDDVKTRRGYIGAVAAAGYRLTTGETKNLTEVPVTFFPKKRSGLQQAFRLREKTWSLNLEVEELGQSVLADVFHLYSLKSGAVYGSVLMNFFVVGSPVTEWRVSIPDGIGNIDVTGQNVGRDWRKEDNTLIVPLSRPLLGAGTLLLTFEQPMNARGGKFSPGVAHPMDVQGERGFVQVVSPLQVNHKSSSDGALLAIDASELPTEFRLLSTSPTLGAWQYTARDFNIEMDVEWFDQGQTVDQVVDFQKLTSHISRDGQWVTDARIFVKTRGRSALRMKLPEGAVLWEAKVNGETVNARADVDETVVPLSSQIDPNQAAEVSLRYGARSDSPRNLELSAPIFDAPLVIGEWIVTGDDGRTLVPDGGSADLVRPVMAESGWDWVGRNSRLASIVFFLGVLMVAVAKTKTSTLGMVGTILLSFAFFILSLGVAVYAASSSLDGSDVVEYAAPVVAANQAMTIEIGNYPDWLARVGGWVMFGFLVGVGLAVRGIIKRDGVWLGSGMLILFASFLSIRGGAAAFFLALACAALFWLVPAIIRAVRSSDTRKSKAAQAAATTAAVLFCLTPWNAEAADVPELKPAESMVHTWDIREGRLAGGMDITVRGESGDRFLLLKAPAVLSKFEGEGMRVVKARHGNSDAYWLLLEADGQRSGKAVFEMPLENPAQGWWWPSGPAAVRKVDISLDQKGWDLICSAAVSSKPLPGGRGESTASMVLGPVDAVTFSARPKQRDAGTEKTRFFSETSNLFIPGPGVVTGQHLVRIRPSQGKVSSLIMKVPTGFTVSDVIDGPVGSWRFDPAKNELKLDVEPAQVGAFAFTVETQRGAGELPVDLSLSPLRVNDTAGEVGLIGIAFVAEVQPEAVKVDGLSRVNPEDFDSGLLPRDANGNPLAILQHAFRYGKGEAKASLKVSAVSPELRAEIWQLVSLGEDRLTVVADLGVTITRSGVFRLDLEVPKELEIESATGEGLSHWTERDDDGQRVVTLHLSGKTMGLRNFSLTLTGRPTGAQKKWMVPRISLREASRETGVLTVVPERGLRVRAVERKNVSQIDPRLLANGTHQAARASARPGALAYRLLQSDWELGLSIRRLDAWVTAKVFHDSTIREGQLLNKVTIDYRIENAAVKSQRVRINGLDSKLANNLRATGSAVADLVPVEGEDNVWEIRFQRGLVGNVEVSLEFQRASSEGDTEMIEPIDLLGVRQQTYMVAVRAGGRLELEAGKLPRGWNRTDWSVVQSLLGKCAGKIVPTMSFRAIDPEGALPVKMKRHELAQLRKIRVSKGKLTTLMSPGGKALTAVNLSMEVIAKSTMRLTLPEGADLFNVFVNDEGASLVREGNDWLFYVFPSPESGMPTEVRFVYSAEIEKGKRLQGPAMDVPMENLTWQVLIPEGWRMSGYGGDFDLQEQSSKGQFKFDDYQTFVQTKRREDAQTAVEQLDKANEWLAKGDQKKASMAFSNVVNNGLLDEASGEDARVQLRRLKTQQAVLGLNTRRQKLVLDNRGAAPDNAQNEQYERAAELNPVMQGQYNYDPQQFEQFLEGNTADENAALKEIANRIVSQQLAAEPAPVAIDVALPERGTVLSFGRSVQIDSDKPMVIDVELKRAGGGFAWIAVMLCLLAGALGVMKTKSQS